MFISHRRNRLLKNPVIYLPYQTHAQKNLNNLFHSKKRSINYIFQRQDIFSVSVASAVCSLVTFHDSSYLAQAWTQCLAHARGQGRQFWIYLHKLICILCHLVSSVRISLEAIKSVHCVHCQCLGVEEMFKLEKPVHHKQEKKKSHSWDKFRFLLLTGRKYRKSLQKLTACESNEGTE